MSKNPTVPSKEDVERTRKLILELENEVSSTLSQCGAVSPEEFKALREKTVSSVEDARELLSREIPSFIQSYLTLLGSIPVEKIVLALKVNVAAMDAVLESPESLEKAAPEIWTPAVISVSSLIAIASSIAASLSTLHALERLRPTSMDSEKEETS